jgi:hypothetical protein
MDAGTELLAIPFQKDYSAYREWKVPPKGGKKRVVLAHGTVPGVRGMYLPGMYNIPGRNGADLSGEEENPPGVLDEDLFSYLEADLAVVGHIHGAYTKQSGDCLIVSPGSARVWREGETGARKALLIDTEALREPETIVLQSAGQYRRINVEVLPDCSLSFPGAFAAGNGLPSPDWLCLNLSGVVEDETEAMENVQRAVAALEKKYRRVTAAHEELLVLKGISTHPLALQFIKKWEAGRGMYAAEDEEVYSRAKLRGLAKIKELVEARK